jgi:predicted PurR-regulated permease PerM
MTLGVRRRGAAVGIVYVVALLLVAGLSATFLPTLVREVNDLAAAIPGYIEDLTKGRGPLGFLERDYEIVARVREAIEKSGVGGVLGLSSTALGVAKSVVTAVVAVVTIAFLTLFMLLEGPSWVERGYELVPGRHRERARRIGQDVYRAVGGYVMGNLAISLIAGIVSAIVFTIVGLPFPYALALVVALLDLIPLAGATIAAVIVTTIAFLDATTAGIVVLVFFIVYQQLENHVLQPVVYGKAVKLSPLSVLVAVLIGAELAGIVGALGAIPVAAAIQVLVRDLRAPTAAVGPPVEASSDPL